MRRFEKEDGSVWEIDLRWNEYSVRAGPAGGATECRKESLPDAAAAARIAEAMIGERLAEGYVELGAEPRLPPPPPPEPEPEPAPAPPPPPAPKPAPAAAPAAAPAGLKRRFEYVEGGSSKFWEVEVTGNRYTVSFGRIGTRGQTRTKSFADAAAAAREARKMVDEKTGKGYVATPLPDPRNTAR